MKNILRKIANAIKKIINKKMGRRRTNFHTYVDVEVEIESYDILELLEEDLESNEYELVEKALKGKSFSKYVDSVGVDVELDFDELLNIIDDCNSTQLEMIRDAVESEDQIKVDNLYDEQKLKVLIFSFPPAANT